MSGANKRLHPFHLPGGCRSGVCGRFAARGPAPDGVMAAFDELLLNVEVRLRRDFG
jgi:hypothetical protein